MTSCLTDISLYEEVMSARKHNYILNENTLTLWLKSAPFHMIVMLNEARKRTNTMTNVDMTMDCLVYLAYTFSHS